MRVLRAFARIGHMLRKELIQTLRDPRTRWLLFGPALVQLVIFGYAATMELKHVSIAVLDLDNTQESRDLISRFSASQYFSLRKYAGRSADLRAGIERGDFLVAVEIDSGFAQRLRGGQDATVQVIVDASNSNTALIGLAYLNEIGMTFARDYQTDWMQRTLPQFAALLPHVEFDARPWFNEGLDSRWYFVPGVIGNLLLIMVMMVTAFSVVREREIGTLEQVMVTPIRRWEFIAGKIVPYFLLGSAEATMLALIGELWFGVPFRGNPAVLVVALAIFLFAALGFGLFISTLAATQQQATVISFFFILPAIMLSGFGTPVSNMPSLLQKLSYIDPLTRVILVLRSVYLKGVGFGELWPEMLVMAVLAWAMLSISIIRFRKSLE